MVVNGNYRLDTVPVSRFCAALGTRDCPQIIVNADSFLALVHPEWYAEPCPRLCPDQHFELGHESDYGV